ncbi:hypothetical protein [Agrobacterium vitis]|uniref:Uncharacterized protein n=1 Tax=Agrobacterium vitis TaxID=373 RepID=A0AAE2RIU2_AGRVI|nr:hypothetical protein [Agrobacterium vitis]MBF2717461.1 hypothetical protein [Agrobacterium vitis]MUZ62626.1 hypothetical protein [Agrobacterium vitis]
MAWKNDKGPEKQKGRGVNPTFPKLALIVASTSVVNEARGFNLKEDRVLTLFAAFS